MISQTTSPINDRLHYQRWIINELEDIGLTKPLLIKALKVHNASIDMVMRAAIPLAEKNQSKLEVYYKAIVIMALQKNKVRIPWLSLPVFNKGKDTFVDVLKKYPCPHVIADCVRFLLKLE